MIELNIYEHWFIENNFIAHILLPELRSFIISPEQDKLTESEHLSNINFEEYPKLLKTSQERIFCKACNKFFTDISEYFVNVKNFLLQHTREFHAKHLPAKLVYLMVDDRISDLEKAGQHPYALSGKAWGCSIYDFDHLYPYWIKIDRSKIALQDWIDDQELDITNDFPDHRINIIYHPDSHGSAMNALSECDNNRWSVVE